MAILKALFSDKKTIQEVFEGVDQTSEEMQKSIERCFDLYFDNKVTNKKDPCQRLPYTIVNKLSKAVFGEYNSDIIHTTDKAVFFDKTLTSLDNIKNDLLQWVLIGGECFLKPVIAYGHFEFTIIRRNGYVVLDKNSMGQITAIGTAEKLSFKNQYFTLFEKRKVDENGYLTIENKLFASTKQNEIGKQCPLSAHPMQKDLKATYTYPIQGLGLVNIKTPMANCVDGSTDGVCIYEAAAGLIENINLNEKLLADEFENGRSRVIVAQDLFRKDGYGKPVFDEKQFIAINDDPKDVGISIFSPPLRNESFESRKQSYLKSCENIIGLKRGILSNVEAVERTATEITSTEGDYSLCIQDLQKMWYDTVVKSLQLCDKLGQMFCLCDNTQTNIKDILSISWGNGVLFDSEKEWQSKLAEVQAGLLKPELALAFKYDLPCETEKDLENIRLKYMPNITEM